LGAGYSHGENGADASPLGTPAAPVGGSTGNTDDRQAWNVGADFDIGPFGIGAIYKEDNGAADGAAADDEETIVVGVDYTTGPFKIGASYLDQDNTFAVDGLDTQRYSGGVTYTYGPGMTFRGSVGYIEHDIPAAADVDGTYVTLGTQINF
jgi:predicted porin